MSLQGPSEAGKSNRTNFNWHLIFTPIFPFFGHISAPSFFNHLQKETISKNLLHSENIAKLILKTGDLRCLKIRRKRVVLESLAGRNGIINSSFRRTLT